MPEENLSAYGIEGKMTKNEFFETLQRSLNGYLSKPEVMENIRYYEEYFRSQEAAGKSEEEILNRLGDPRLIARTIVEAKEREAGVTEEYYSSETIVEDEGRQENPEFSGGKVYRMPGWLLAVIAIAVIVLIIGVVTSVLSFILPILLPVLLVLLIVKLIRDHS